MWTEGDSMGLTHCHMNWPQLWVSMAVWSTFLGDRSWDTQISIVDEWPMPWCHKSWKLRCFLRMWQIRWRWFWHILLYSYSGTTVKAVNVHVFWPWVFLPWRSSFEMASRDAGTLAQVGRWSGCTLGVLWLLENQLLVYIYISIRVGPLQKG